MSKFNDRTLLQIRQKSTRERFLSEHLDDCLPLQIKALRRRAKMSQSDLAKRLGVSQPFIARIEKPGTRISLYTLERVASALDVAILTKFCTWYEWMNWHQEFDPTTFEAASFKEDRDVQYEVNNADYDEANRKARSTLNLPDP
jgi:transcriptional regulator with XRE-family HTH domain